MYSSDNLAACYQLMQPVLKIDFYASKNDGIGGHSYDIQCTWKLYWPWLVLARPVTGIFGPENFGPPTIHHLYVM